MCTAYGMSVRPQTFNESVLGKAAGRCSHLLLLTFSQRHLQRDILFIVGTVAFVGLGRNADFFSQSKAKQPHLYSLCRGIYETTLLLGEILPASRRRLL